MSLSAIPKALRSEVFVRDQGRCRYCGVFQVGQAAAFHVNHVRPRSKGGPTTIENLVLQCPHCSLHKLDKTSATDPKTNVSAVLFHPLQGHWGDHFSMSADGSITGKSEMGRATVIALKMNDLWPRSARALQIAIGWLSIDGESLPPDTGERESA